MDEMCVPLIITKAVHGSSIHTFVSPKEQQEAASRMLGGFSLLAPSYRGDGATSFNPFLPKLVFPCDVFSATLMKTLDYDIHRRLGELAATGVKQHVIFAATVGRSGTTHLANLVASSGQVISTHLPARFSSSCSLCTTKTFVQAVVTHDSSFCMGGIKKSPLLKLHEILLALEAATASGANAAVYAEFTAFFMIYCT
jgi:hypothetical protein